MRRRVLTTFAVLAVLCSTLGCPGSRSADPQGPGSATPTEVVAAAKATIEQWRQAYEVRSAEALAKLYAHDLDLVVVQEGTAALGWSSVEATLKDRLARASSIRIRLKDVQVLSLAPDVATAVATMTRELSEGSTTVTESGTLTLVLRKRDDAWVITTEHYSYKRAG